MSDEQICKLHRGGHDPQKVYNAYKAAMEHKGGPTVILAKTVKGYGLGEAGEGRNATHQQKKLNEEEIEHFRTRFEIPIPGRSGAQCARSIVRRRTAPRLRICTSAAAAGRIHARAASVPASSDRSAAARVI